MSLILTAKNAAVASVNDYFMTIEHWHLSSTDKKRHYHITILVPRGYGNKKLPACIFLDGNAIYSAICNDPSGYAAYGAVLITVGYRGAKDVCTTSRSFDYIPHVNYPQPTMAEQTRQLLGGGGETFIQFITEQILAPAIKIFPIKTGQITLYGHSLGGVFSLYCLFYYPHIFNKYVSADPSLWWNNGHLTKIPGTKTKLHELPKTQTKKLCLIVGESASVMAKNTRYKLRPGITYEIAQKIRQERACVPPTAALKLYHHLHCQKTDCLSHLDVTFKYFSGVLHGPLLYQTIPEALKFTIKN